MPPSGRLSPSSASTVSVLQDARSIVVLQEPPNSRLAVPAVLCERERRGDMGVVTQALREVTEQPRVLWVVLLGKKAEVVRARERPVEHLTRLVEPILL